MIEKANSQPMFSTPRQIDNTLHIEKQTDTEKIEASETSFPPNSFHKKEEKLNEMIQSINDIIQPPHTSLKFELHEKLDDYYVTVIDDSTKEVIREIPSKKMLDMYAAMREFMGLMVDEKI